MTTASWVIVERTSGRAVLETFSRPVADAINREKYDVLPILDWLQLINRRIRQGDNYLGYARFGGM